MLENKTRGNIALKMMNSIQSLTSSVNQLTDENVALKNELVLLRNKYDEVMADYGQLMVEKTAKEKRAQKNEFFQQKSQSTSPVNNVSSNHLENNQSNTANQTPPTLNASNIIQERETGSYEESSQSEDVQDAGSSPRALLVATLYNNYKLLLINLAQRLLSSEVVMLKDWAAQNFSIVNPQNPTDVLFQLHEKRIINASDLGQLCNFFESIVRFDLVYIVDAFLRGDYSLLRQIPPSKKRNTSGAQYSQHESTSRNVNFDQPLLHHPVDISTADSGFTRAVPGNSSTRANPSLTDNTQTAGINGSEQSISQCPATEQSNVYNFPSAGASENRDLPRVSNYLCSHHKRLCSSKFNCSCANFFPCHRCHNSRGTCGQKNLEPRGTKLLKCEHCNKQQKFAQFCCNCNTKFANYYCDTCKHLTGNENRPYHCVKCGICRIHEDRSFHCDVCGVCFEEQYRELHNCHDICCVCLKEALTGWLILPCRHKVHLWCVSRTTQYGM